MSDALKRVLFVDDEVNVLKGLERMLRPYRHEWDMHFLEGSEPALRAIESGETFDVVVTDVCMPHMDGVSFLEAVKARLPNAVRFVLSGNTDARTMMQASTIAHQYLNKPCDPHVLQVQITRALALRRHLQSGPLKQLLHEIGALPSIPTLYQEVVAEVNSPDPTVARVAEIIERDAGMSAKVLQIINSAFIGLSQRVSSVPHAVSLLGLDNIRNMVLLSGVFFAFEGLSRSKNVSLDTLWGHSMDVGRFAMAIARHESSDRHLAHAAFTAGILHEVGLIVLSARIPEQLDQAFDWARANNEPLHRGEREILGATDAQIGGYLLELWGLPDPIAEAIAYHDLPSACPEELYAGETAEHVSPLTAVHVANYFCETDPTEEARVDDVYLNRLGLSGRIGDWWDVCHAELPQR